MGLCASGQKGLSGAGGGGGGGGISTCVESPLGSIESGVVVQIQPYGIFTFCNFRTQHLQNFLDIIISHALTIQGNT